MNAKRTEPRVHCYQRPLQGGYVQRLEQRPNTCAVFDAVPAPGRCRQAAPPPPSTRSAHHQPRQAQLQPGGLK